MKAIISIALVILSITSKAQSFEGTLVYVSDFEVAEKMSKMGVTKEMLIERLKAEGTYSDTISVQYKNGNYFSKLNTHPESWTIYRADSNKIYSFQNGGNAELCTVTDASIDLENTLIGKMPVISKLDSIAIVGADTCSIVRVQWKSGTYDYYYRPGQLQADPALYAAHIYDGWAGFLAISKSLPVRIVKSTMGMMKISMTLVSSKREPVDEKIFRIPELIEDKDLNLVKNAGRKVMRVKH
jgi:hypothetical protein